VLLCVWSPKGGSGTSVFAAACALALARAGGARLGDLVGDQPAVLGLGVEPDRGLRDWLRVGADAPTDALERIAVGAGRALALLPAGGGDLAGVAPEAGAALGVALRSSDVPTVLDAGSEVVPAVDALLEVADATVVAMRGCYLALRRAARSPIVARSAGVVLLEESGRALGAREVHDVLGVPVLATVAVRASVARVVDAGVLATRLPDTLGRPARELLSRVGFGCEGRAA